MVSFKNVDLYCVYSILPTKNVKNLSLEVTGQLGPYNSTNHVKDGRVH